MICNKLFILAPLYFKQTSGFSAFIITTIVFAVALLIWRIYCKFYSTSINSLIHNPLLRVSYISVIVTVCTIVTAITIDRYSLEINSSVLHKTPLWIITLTFLVTMSLSLRYKLKDIGATNAIFVPVIYSIAITLLIISVEKNDLYNLFPIIDTNYNSVLKKAGLMFSMLFELIFLYFLPDLLETSSDTEHIGSKIVYRSYIYYLVISVVFSMVLPEVTNGNAEPFFKILKHAHIGRMHVKLDSIFLILYCFSAYSYISSMLLFVFRIVEISFKKASAYIIKLLSLLLIYFVSLTTTASNLIFTFLSNYYIVLCVITFILPTVIIIINRVSKCNAKN